MAITFEMRGREGPAGLGPASQGPLDRARAFRSARRHSLLVRALRIALPVVTLGAAAVYLIALNTAWKIGPGRLNLGQVELTADDLTMKNPSYFGVTKDGGRYQVRAKRAVVEFNRQQAPIKLIDVDGDLIRSNNLTTKLKAKHGLLDNANSQLELYDGIEIDTSNGMAARLSRATITMKEHRVVSNEPVTASTATGNIRSAGMNLKTDTQQATFEGNVIVRLVGSGGQGVGGFGRDARQPIEVNADRLDVNDASKTARFTGSVTATQGESTLKSPELTVTYEGKAASAQLSGPPNPDEQASRLSRLVASNGAVITASGDRRVKSEKGRLRRQGRHGTLYGWRGGQPGPQCAQRAPDVRRPESGQEPPRCSRRRCAGAGPDYGDLLPDGGQGRAGQVQGGRHRGGRRRAGTTVRLLQDRPQCADRHRS